MWFYQKCIFLYVLLVPIISYSAKDAVVIVESAIVYSEASFDSPPVGHLDLNEKVRVSEHTHGAFYRVKSDSGLLGYVSDVDVKVEGMAHPSEKLGFGDEDNNDKPFPLRLFVGPVVSMTKYEEKVLGAEYNDDTTMWGLLFSGPLKLFEGSPLMFDGTALIHLGVPQYYDEISRLKLNSSGYFIISSLAIKWPVMVFSGLKGLVTFQFGGLLSYSRFSLKQGVRSPLNLRGVFPVRELRAGVLFGIGVSHLITKNILMSFNPRYYVERSKYLSFELALQYGF